MDLQSGYPYSLIKNGLPFDYPKLTTDLRKDVAIIGAGISGALSAWYLTQAGFSCVVVDARTVGLGSTSASTSLLQYELDMPLYKLIRLKGREHAERAYQLCSEAIDTLEDIAKETGADFQRSHSLYFTAKASDKRMLEEECKARSEAGFDVRMLDAHELEHRYGLHAQAAILSRQAASIDAYMLSHHIYKLCRGKGLEVYDRTPVVKTRYHPRHVELITGKGHTIKASHVVNATGYEAEAVMGTRLVKLRTTYAVASEQLNSKVWKDHTLMWNTADPYLYMRCTADNRMLVGGRDEIYRADGSGDRLMKTKMKALIRDFNRCFPHIPFVPEFSWAGTFGTTPDAMPYIGHHPKFPRTSFALGFGGNGITFSLIAARMIAEELAGHRNSDMKLFSFDRKKERRP